MIVVDKNGVQGVVEDTNLAVTSGNKLLVHFQNGQQVIVPSNLLIRQEDGRYRLQVSLDELYTGEANLSPQDTSTIARDSMTVATNETDQLVVPVIEEVMTVQKHLVESGIVEIRKSVHERIETVDLPLLAEEVEVERIPVNRIVEAPVPIRYEGDTTIISLLEEVLVVEKRLLVREEVHIKKLQHEVQAPQEVHLREERVEIVRKPGTGQEVPQSNATISRE